MKKIILAIAGILLLWSLSFPWGEKYYCPHDECQLTWTGQSWTDNWGHTFYVYWCGCCGKKYSVRD